MAEPPIYLEVRECREAIAALSIMVASGNTETRRTLAHVNEVLEEQKQTLAVVQQTLALIKQILSDVQPPEIAAVRFGWGDNLTTYPVPADPNEVIIMSDFDLPDTDSATATVAAPLDGAGNAIAGLDAPTWTTDVTTFVTLAVADDGMSAVATPVDGAGVGTTNVTVSFGSNADGKPITGTSSVTTELTDAATPSIAWADDGVITPAPVDTPPSDNPPVDTPPVDTPPVDTPPSDTPPSDTPPSDTPPSDTPPSDTPPAA